MKYTTCQLVQGGVIRGVIHYIGKTDPVWPLCNHHQIRLCQRAPVQFLPTETGATCRHCANTTSAIPLAIDAEATS
jgi:hypothetical protein